MEEQYLAPALLIDDDVQLLETVQRNAEEEQLALDIADSWDRGLALFQARAPDLVIADYNLPGSAYGLQLLLEVKRLRPAVRVVLISGVVDPEELDRVEQLGLVDRVMSKGSAIETTKELLNEIREANNAQTQPTDWPVAARSLVERLKLDKKAIDELDDRLRTGSERGR
jgi:DNA-binding NtrC family response regulator